MQRVDDQRVGVSTPVFRQMWVVRGQVGVIMHDLVGVDGGPEPYDGDKSQRTDRSERQSSGRQAHRSSGPARQRVGHKLGGMAERELCGNDRRAILWPGGAVQNAADRRLAQGKAVDDPRY